MNGIIDQLEDFLVFLIELVFIGLAFSVLGVFVSTIAILILQ